ncbi:hypothetical protein V7S43_018273 [Phytophthora oleae]|uniref:Purple acid phosphatase C-terminal domain-containing protein n=1 Tax=Phytophthora oleae TaxID=2107226 RepID=A0ABD3EU58_9STRA
MKTQVLGFLAVAIVSVAAKTVLVDDSVCVWSYSLSSLGCQPSALCEYNYNAGDLTLSESCRVKAGVNYYPQQIHLAFAGETAGTGMTVSWATYEQVNDSSLWVGAANSRPIHFTSMSAESDYPNAPTNAYTLTHKNGNFGDQVGWMEAELEKANANRDNVPWIIVGMHRLIYDVGGCGDDGIPTEDNLYLQEAFEALFLKYKVDVVVVGHRHYYERQLPIANSSAIMDGVSDDYKLYDNPQAPVHILTGAAGNVENLRAAPNGTAPWNAAYDYSHFGFSTLEANRTVLSWKYLASSDLSVQDEFVMYKNIPSTDSSAVGTVSAKV